MLKPITFQLPEDTIASLQKFVLKQKTKNKKEKISQQKIANEAVLAYITPVKATGTLLAKKGDKGGRK